MATTKICKICGDSFPLDNFYKSKDKYSPYCKPCHRKKCAAANRKSRKAHPEKKREWDLRRRRVGIARNQAWVDAHKAACPCAHCGFDGNVRAKQFHHRDPSNKVKNISRMVNHPASMKRLIAEVEKCDVLCANCHSILHCSNGGPGYS